MRCRWTMLLVVVLAGTVYEVPRVAAGVERDDVAGMRTEVRRLLGDAQLAELEGDAARREALLRDAIVMDPDCELARWQLGQMKVDGRWQTVDDVQRATASDPRYAEYVRLRGEYGQTGEGHLALARWCKRQGLKPEANFHWAAVLTHEANHEEALRELGKRWVDGRLLTYDERVELTNERREARKMGQKWSARLAGWERDIAGSDVVARTEALAEIRAIRDEHAIVALEDATLKINGSDEREIERAHTIGIAFVEALAAMEGKSSVTSLLRHSIYAHSLEVRHAAMDELKARSPYAYVPQLLDALSMPVESTFHIATDRNGSVYYYHELFREGAFSNTRVETQLTVRQVDMEGVNTRIAYNEDYELRGIQKTRENVTARKGRIAATSQARFANAAAFAEQRVAQENYSSESLNSRVAAALERTTGQKHGVDPRAWWDWWQDYSEYYVPEDRPDHEYSYVDSEQYYYRPPSKSYVYTPDPPPPPPPGSYPRSCFAAGTLVWTKSGQRPIESLEIGELVLSQEIGSGELCFQPIIGRTLRPPSEMLKLSYSGETLRTTLGHPMWVAGEGWQMAKEIDEGNVLHSVAGPVSVDAIEPDGEEQAYNLVVANTNNYFVGKQGVLVHDNTPRLPTRAKVPGWIGADEEAGTHETASDDGLKSVLLRKTSQ